MQRWMIRFAVALVATLMLAAPTLAVGKGKGHVDPEARFKKLDTNNDSKVSLDEFKAAFPADKAVNAEKRFKHMDTNGDGSLSLEEFKAGQPKPKQENK